MGSGLLKIMDGEKRMKESEADLKRTVTDYLEYQQNAGKLLYFRLNAGDFIELRGNTRRRVKGCMAGTSDLEIIKDGKPIFFELKSARGRTSPAQNAFKILVEEQGASYSIVRSLEELEELLGI